MKKLILFAVSASALACMTAPAVAATSDMTQPAVQVDRINVTNSSGHLAGTALDAIAKDSIGHSSLQPLSAANGGHRATVIDKAGLLSDTPVLGVSDNGSFSAAVGVDDSPGSMTSAASAS